MIKRSSKYYLLQGIVVLVLALVCLVSYALTQSLKVAEDKYMDKLEYVSYEILTDNVMPVSKEEQIIENQNQETEEVNQTNEIIRPYTNENVTIGKNYYDYKGEAKTQENSITYYENTYIQNTGVDYVYKEVFEVVSIADGTVMSITEDDIVGKTIKIEHNNNMISVYQGIKDVTINENDNVTKGQVIAYSGTNNINSELGNHLHFELYNENILVNPEEFFNKTEG